MLYKYSIVTLARWESPYLLEWTSYHRDLGFDHVYFYCNEDTPAETYELLLPFLGKYPFVTFVHFPYQGQQSYMYRHFFENFMSQTEWFCFLDIDEFLRIQAEPDIHHLMSSFPSDWDSIYFNWIFFGTNGFKSRPSGSVLRNYTRRQAGLDVNTKTLTRSKKIDATSAYRTFWHHWLGMPGLKKRNVIGDDMENYWSSFPQSAREYLSRPGIQRRIAEIAVVNHYAFKSEEDFTLRASCGTLGEFAGQSRWKSLAEGSEFKTALDAGNAVEDTELRDRWDAAVTSAAYSTSVVPWPRWPNLALGKPADQSSISEWSIGRTTHDDAAGLVNGIITGRYNSCTANQPLPWWRVDLGQESRIHEVRIFNRLDDAKCSARLQRFAIDVSADDQEWETVLSVTADRTIGGADGKPFIHPLDPVVAARYVRVRLLGVGFLHLDQVEVYGDPGTGEGYRSEGTPAPSERQHSATAAEAARRALMPSDTDRPDLGGNVWMGDSRTFMPRLWRFLVERYAVKSVLDVGCGEGHAVAFFHSLGIHAHGIEGLPANIHRAVAPIALHDILLGAYTMPVDLVWSCEVAEHIFPEKVDNYLDTLINGKVIAMTHALPGQPGHHHVNCQPSEYWIERLQQKGCMYRDEETRFLRAIASREETENYFTRSGLLFYRPLTDAD